MKNPKPISEIDILLYHLQQTEELLIEPIQFETKIEMTDYQRDILSHVISIKVILKEYFRI